jgi:hypothetical protein
MASRTLKAIDPTAAYSRDILTYFIRETRSDLAQK